MRRLIALLAPLPLALAGCSLLTPITLPGPGGTGDGALGVGSCLSSMNGQDSDRTSLVPCDGPHLFEVTGIEEWPGMGAALEGADPGEVWDEIYTPDGGGYVDWASDACNAAAQRVLGIDGIELEGRSAVELKLRAGGDYGIDLSLGSRAEFVAGDHRTVCSVAWYDGDGTPREVTNPVGLGFAQFLGPEFPLTMRECWDAEGYVVPCSRSHAAQAVVGFEGHGVFADELIARVAEGEPTQDDFDTTDAVCQELMMDIVPGSMDAELGFLAESSYGYGWEEWDGEVDPGGGYFFSCLLVPWEEGARMTGDIFDGSIEITT